MKFKQFYSIVLDSWLLLNEAIQIDMSYLTELFKCIYHGQIIKK